MMNNKRIVVTGLGVISSIGFGIGKFWPALLAGKSGISEVEAFDTSQTGNLFAGEIKKFDPIDYMPESTAENIGRTTQLAIASTKLALKKSDVSLDQLNLDNAGVIFGTTIGEGQVSVEINKAWLSNGVKGVPKDLFPKYPYWDISRNVAREHNFCGPNMMIPTACAAGNYAIGRACDLIKAGDADLMIAGGSDALSFSSFIGFSRLMSMSKDKVKPFDKNRKGMMVGEGAAALVLEDYDHALARNAPIVAEVIGYGFSCDAHHMTAPHPEGEGAVLAINAALGMAKIKPTEVNYISAHGTGTQANDISETIAIKKVFGENAKNIPVSSIKSMLGHCMGAASAIEAVTCCLTVQNNKIPPTMNYEKADPKCNLDYVPNVSREQDVRIAMSNAFAFGGNNACLLVRNYE